MDQKFAISVAVVFVLGFAAGFSLNSPQESKFSTEMNVTVDPSVGVADVEFDNRSFRILHDNSAKGSFFLDLDSDADTEREIEITRDGKIHQKKFLVGLNGKTYTVQVRYMDDPGKRNDAWMTVLRIEEV